MGTPGWRPRLRAATIATVVAAAMLTVGPAGSAEEITASATAAPGPMKIGTSKVVNSAAPLRFGVGDPRGAVPVFVRLTGPGAAQAAANAGRAAGKPAALARRAAVGSTATAVFKAVRAADPRAAELYRVTDAVPGLAVLAGPAAINAISGRPDVLSVSRLIPKTVAAAPSDPVSTAPVARGDLSGVGTGRGITVGLIDTGIDYTQAALGGPGTESAYQAARKSADWKPTAKVVGGRDFVGDGYDPDPLLPDGGANPNYHPVPVPDRNPMDCQGHGSQVATTIAGVGMTADGRPAGPTTAAERLSMPVPPGAAPEASLYALKVFGCSGSTLAVIPALDATLDPNGDGDFSDHLDVVDLSLTSGYGQVDDPDLAVIDAVAVHGVLPVVAAGNGGDTTGAMGSPATATRALTVAAAMDGFRRLDGLAVSTGATASGQVSVDYPWQGARPVTGELVRLGPDNADGCQPLSPEDAAAVRSKVAWLSWDDNDTSRACGSAERSANVRAAGAVGAVLTSSAPTFSAAISGDRQIPVFQLTATATATLSGLVGTGVTVTFDPGLRQQDSYVDPAVEGLLPAWSARGAYQGVIKPDLAAPGTSVPVGVLGDPAGTRLRSGTSMAAARAAGIAATVRAAHPWWSVEQVKAALMNTATDDIHSGATSYGPARVGAGGIVAAEAVSAQVLAYSTNHPGAVSVSFGAVEVDATAAEVVNTESVTVVNAGADRAELTLRYQGVVSQPGVTFDVVPATMSLAPGDSALATVVMTVNPADLRRVPDPTLEAQQSNQVTGLDEARQFVADASGRVVLTAAGGPGLRVPVFGAAKPVAHIQARAGTVDGRPAVVLTGRGVPSSTGFQSLVSVTELGYAASVDGCGSRCGAGRLLAVGAGSSGVPGPGQPDARLWFAVSTAGNWRALGTGLLPTVSIDTDGDRTADFTVQVRSVGGADLLAAYTFRGSGASAKLIGINPVNFNAGSVDTNVFDNSVVLIPVDPSLLGLTDASGPINYAVATWSATAVRAGGTLDGTGWISYDVLRPQVRTDVPLWIDSDDTGIPYSLSAGVTGVRALVLHLQGPTGGRQEILTLG